MQSTEQVLNPPYAMCCRLALPLKLYPLMLGGICNAVKSHQPVKEAVLCRSWDSPFKASPPQSDSSIFSCHSSYESVNILADVPGMQAFSAPSFSTPGFIEVTSRLPVHLRNVCLPLHAVQVPAGKHVEPSMHLGPLTCVSWCIGST